MKLYKNKILSSVLFIAVLFVLSECEFFHHHDSGGSDDKCFACIIHSTVSSSDISEVSTFFNPSNFWIISSDLNSDVPDYFFISSHSGRAPPSDLL